MWHSKAHTYPTRRKLPLLWLCSFLGQNCLVSHHEMWPGSNRRPVSIVRKYGLRPEGNFFFCEGKTWLKSTDPNLISWVYIFFPIDPQMLHKAQSFPSQADRASEPPWHILPIHLCRSWLTCPAVPDAW